MKMQQYKHVYKIYVFLYIYFLYLGLARFCCHGDVTFNKVVTLSRDFMSYVVN